MLVPGAVSLAGSGAQTAVYTLPMDQQSVCRWIDAHWKELDQSSGARVVATRGRVSEVTQDTKRGEFTFVLDHSKIGRGHYRVKLTKTLRGDLIEQETEITVEPQASGSHVTVRMTATVNDANVVEINLGLRRSLRKMQDLLERTFEQ